MTPGLCYEKYYYWFNPDEDASGRLLGLVSRDTYCRLGECYDSGEPRTIVLVALEDELKDVTDFVVLLAGTLGSILTTINGLEGLCSHLRVESHVEDARKLLSELKDEICDELLFQDDAGLKVFDAVFSGHGWDNQGFRWTEDGLNNGVAWEQVFLVNLDTGRRRYDHSAWPTYHLDVTSPSLRGKIRLTACGRGGTTIATTGDPDKIDCLSCRRTKKFKVLARGATEARDG